MKKSTGLFIAELRKEKSLTQKQLAEILGVSDKTVSHWEREESSPDISLLPEIAKLFDITTDELLSGEKSAEKSEAKKILQAVESSWSQGEGTVKLLAEKYVQEFTNKNFICAAVSILALLCGFIVLYLERGYNDGATAVLVLILIADLFAVAVFRGNFNRILQITQIGEDSVKSLRQRANRITALTCYLILLVSAFSFYFLVNIWGALTFLCIDGGVIFICEIYLRKKGVLAPKGYSERTKKLFLINIIAVSLLCLLVFSGVLLQNNFNEQYILKNKAEALLFSSEQEFKDYMQTDLSAPENTAELDDLYENNFLSLQQDIMEDYAILWYKDESGINNMIDFEWNNRGVCMVEPYTELPIKVYTYSALQKAKDENITLINSLNLIYIAYYVTTLSASIFVYIVLTKKVLKRYPSAQKHRHSKHLTKYF